MRVGLSDAVAYLAERGGERYATVFERGSVSVEVYAPRGRDLQGPHTRDELYFVATGQGTFVCGEERTRFVPGDMLFVPAGVPHRFESFGPDLVVWVVFYGPLRGEHPGHLRVLGSRETE